MKYSILVLIIFSVFMSSCTSYRALEDERTKTAAAHKELDQMRTDYNTMKRSVDSTEELRVSLTKQIERLKKDTATVNESLRNYIVLDKENKLRMEQLSKTTDRILDANLGENERLIAQIQDQKSDLERQKADLEKQKSEFEKQKSDYEKVRGDLSFKENEIRQLQQALEKQKNTVKELQEKVANALTGFKTSGLDVVERNGKVYVLMPEALLFKSGSKAINSNGLEAIRQLAYVLNANPDINIAVEGHTDNVPYKPKTANALVEDNWDLSVLRATSVVKALTTSGVSPLRISAQGRGEYIPVNNANTTEARAINRRTEIILSPKLDELLKSIE